MKHLKHIIATVAALFVALVVAAPAFAQEKAYAGTDGDGATITVNNPAQGETYSVYKLFDATVSDGNIAYQGTVPSGLGDFFEADSEGNIKPKAAILVDPNDISKGTKMTDELKAALETWAGTATAAASETSDGTVLKFTGLPYGYYVMATTHQDQTAGKALITVTSTKPNAAINDKNTEEPSASKKVNGKDSDSVSVGDTVTYTAEFDTTNWMGEGDAAKQVIQYVISDTLPSFLGDVAVTKVEVGEDEITPTPSFDANKKITIAWADEIAGSDPKAYDSKYANGTKIKITYTAKVLAAANVGSANDNKVSIMPQVDKGNGTPEPWSETDKWNDTATIYVHAAALQKTDGSTALAGAEFHFKGLVVSGTPGFYTVVSYDPAATTYGTTMKCDANGKLVIAGIDADGTTPIKLVGEETKAPDGYNKLTSTFDLQTIVMSTQTTTTHGSKTTYYDPDGNIVDEEVTGGSSVTRNEITAISEIPTASIMEIVNQEGTELPETGGMGTTVLYAAGAALVVCGGIYLVTKKRMGAAE